MSDLQQIFGAGFDTNSVEPQSDYEVLPPGKYPVIIEKAAVKPTKKGDGHYIELTLSVLDGPGKNRKLWDRINIQNPNQACTEIGLRSLAALGQAIGLMAIVDTQQLLNQVCIASVKVKDNQNEIRTYSKLVYENGAPPAPVVTPTYPTGPANYETKRNDPASGNNPGVAPSQSTSSTAGASTPPWMRK